MIKLLTVEEAAAALHEAVTVAYIRAAIREKRLANEPSGLGFNSSAPRHPHIATAPPATPA